MLHFRTPLFFLFNAACVKPRPALAARVHLHHFDTRRGKEQVHYEPTVWRLETDDGRPASALEDLVQAIHSNRLTGVRKGSFGAAKRRSRSPWTRRTRLRAVEAPAGDPGTVPQEGRAS